MSYPPKIYGEQDDLSPDDREGLRARSPVPSVTERKDQDEEELNAVRRYEDFTTVGTWLESSGGHLAIFLGLMVQIGSRIVYMRGHYGQKVQQGVVRHSPGWTTWMVSLGTCGG